jgi:hypothetical protein
MVNKQPDWNQWIYERDRGKKGLRLWSILNARVSTTYSVIQVNISKEFYKNWRILVDSTLKKEATE